MTKTEKVRKSDMMSCKRKIRYRSQIRAENALEQMLIKLVARDSLYLHSYRCSSCNGWHLGNGNQKQGKLGITDGKA